MTRIQVQLPLQQPLSQVHFAALAGTSKIYGILAAKPGPSLRSIVVEYDATRLSSREVEAAMRRVGIPVGPGK
jgi:hypothetical protein